MGYWITYLKGFGTFKIGPLTPESVNQWHYWFISLLLVFFIGFALLYSAKNRWLGNPANSSISEPVRTESILRVLFVAGVLTSLAYFIVSLFIPDMSWVTIDLLLQFQPTHLVFYLAYFILGVFAYSRRWFAGNEFPCRLSIWVPVGLLLAVGFLITGQGIFSNPATSHELSAALLVLFSLLRSFLCLASLVMSIAFALRYRNSLSPVQPEACSEFLQHLPDSSRFCDYVPAYPDGLAGRATHGQSGNRFSLRASYKLWDQPTDQSIPPCIRALSSRFVFTRCGNHMVAQRTNQTLKHTFLKKTDFRPAE